MYSVLQIWTIQFPHSLPPATQVYSQRPCCSWSSRFMRCNLEECAVCCHMPGCERLARPATELTWLQMLDRGTVFKQSCPGLCARWYAGQNISLHTRHATQINTKYSSVFLQLLIYFLHPKLMLTYLNHTSKIRSCLYTSLNNLYYV